MFRWLESRVLWGLLLIAGGVLFLLQNLGLFEFSDLFWALLLGVGGLFFLSVFAQNRENWWALIPGMALIGVALVIASSRLAPAFGEAWGGSIVLGSLAVAFLAIYAVDRRQWWAMIPGGVMATLTVITGLDSLLPGMETGGLFMFGLALTFGFIAILPTPEGQQRWALIPAGILFVVGILITAAAGNLIAIIWPLFLIGAGGFLLLRAVLPNRRR